MRTHTNDFKEELKVFGRQIQGKITYYPSYDLVSEASDNILTESDLQIISEQANYNDPTEIDAEDIFSISIIKNGDLLQSLMKEFDFETKEELNIGSVVNPQFCLLVNGEYEFLDYGNYIINSKEFNMDTETWSYVCYDKMLFSMVKYRELSNVEYPITIKQFIDKLCNKVGLEFQDSEFVNQGQLIYEDLYKNRDVTYRDIFDEISKIVAGNLLINDSDKLEVGYPNKASNSKNVSGSNISIEAVEEPILDVKLEGSTQQNTAILPSEYTQVDYIESHHAEYIGTGYYCNSNTRIECDFQFTQVTQKQQRVFGNIDGETDGLSVNMYINGSGKFAWTCQNGNGNWKATTLNADTNKHKFVMDMKNNKIYIDDYAENITTTHTNTAQNSLYLLAYRGNSGAVVAKETLAYGKMYSAKIYDNNILVRDFIPCYRNSDNEVGLYDLVNNVFYINQGTGAFTYGSVVNIPNPDYPQNIDVVTGEQNVEIVGKNLFDKDNANILKVYTSSTLVNSPTSSTLYIKCKPNTTYTISRQLIGKRFQVGECNTIPTIGVALSNLVPSNFINELSSITITTSDTAKYLCVFYSNVYGGLDNNNGYTEEEIRGSIQIEVGSTPTSYEPYQSQNYSINLGNIELCKIGDYQDYIYNQNGDWYLHKEIGKVILNGSSNENWSYQNNARFFLNWDYFSDETIAKNFSGNEIYGLYCNRFKEVTRGQTWAGVEGISYDNPSTRGATFDIACNSVATTVNDFKTWLSNNPLEVVYILQNPQDTQITDTTLIQQLENLKNATLFNGVNNISVDGDLPSILNLDYISEYESINEDYLKDTNVRMSEKIGVINSVAILDSDNDLQYIAEDTQSIKENEMTRVTITDNLLALNGDTNTIALNILNKLNGLYYYANDLQTTGVCYYDFLDLFNVEARGNIYQCLLLNNEITITQGIEEHIFTERFEEVETSANEYTTSVISNKEVQFKINQQEGRIESKVEKDGVISAINQSAEEIQINADKLSLEGKNINLTGDNIKITGKNLDIDSKGQMTLFDDSAEKAFSDEDPDMAYIIKSTFNSEYQGQSNYLSFKNKIFANGRKNEYENDNQIQQSTGYGHYFGGVEESLYRYPMQRLYFQTEDYNLIQQTGFLQELNLSVNMLYFLNYNGSSQSQPITLDGVTGNIRCVSLTQTSKSEDKKNFEKLTNAKDILNQVDIYKYNFKDEDDDIKKSIGFVIGDDFNYSEDITSEKNDGANIYSMVSVLWQVVKEQQEEIKELKEMIKNGKY